ncbi:hypothetical protein JCGZ_26848 [Jatropha curcas]|uniref:Uncharacterized protein n=1 Tax=Jatropha curcas TaxID=180498 RepID=A0A067LBG1_JATCU|nr:uncharacterized protein LOC110009117 [Jatropha curcas]KDP41830.1 hypothetical protein JCGZ_26848 [Jatropha curcas]
MVFTLWYFLQSSPEASVPFPWERCFDARDQILYYKNALNETIVIDLRTRVNLGGGLFHRSNMWFDLTGRCCRHCDHQHSLFSERRQYEQDPPFMIKAHCCGPLVYLLLPEMVHRCPVCDCHLLYFG